MESGSTPPEPNGDSTLSDRIPRGAIVVVIVGVIATIAAALLTGGSASSEAAHLEWVQQAKVDDSKTVPVEGGDGTMQLVDGTIQTTGTNVEGYSLFRVRNTVKIAKGTPLRDAKLTCTIHATKAGTEIAQSYGELRMLYPRSSETGIYGQPVEERVVAHFASHSYHYAVVEVGFDMPERYTSVEGVKLEWGEYETGTEHLIYTLPEGPAKADIELPFYSIWKTRTPAAAKIGCGLVDGDGKWSTATEGSLPKIGRPINEEEDESEKEAIEAEEDEGVESEGGGEAEEVEGE